MGSFSIWHWLIVLLVVILIFGTKKLRNMGSDLGGAMKGFKEGMRSEPEVPKDDAHKQVLMRTNNRDTGDRHERTSRML